MKVSKTGKPLCCCCRKLAVQILTGRGYDHMAKRPMALYYCAEHAREGSQALCQDCHAAPVKYAGVPECAACMEKHSVTMPAQVWQEVAPRFQSMMDRLLPDAG